MNKRTVAISGIWLRRIEGSLEVLAEVNGVWVRVIDERLDRSSYLPAISHIVEVGGIEAACVDPVMAAIQEQRQQF